MRPTKKSSLALFATLLLACSDADPRPLPSVGELPDEPSEIEVDAGAELEPELEPAFTLELSQDKLPIAQGGSVRLEVHVVRKPGFTGAIVLSAAGLPSGVSFAPVTVTTDQDLVRVELSASASAPHSLPTTITVRGVSGALNAERSATVTVTGAPGALDTSFGGGNAVLPSGAGDEYAYALAAQPDGKLIAVGLSPENHGDFAVLRVQRDGMLDPTFGSAGVVHSAIGQGSDTAYAVTVQQDGKILVAGSALVTGSGLDFALARYNADGRLDPTFGSAGSVTTAFGPDSDTAYAVLLQADGKILVGGESNRGSSSSGVDFALARYLADGSLDASFGNAGKLTTSLAAASGRDTIYALALQQVGGETRIVAAGGEGDFALARYTDKGELDASFGVGGKKVGVFGSAIGAARALQVDSQGRILVAGHHTNDFALVRLVSDGAFDTGFGSAGKVVTPLSESNWDAAHAIAVQSDGRIVLGGWVYEGGSSAGNFALVRYTADGALDTSFGSQGKVISDISGPTKRDEIRALVLQTDERVPTTRAVVAGFANGANQDVAIARYWL
jgi:uncharacterized delta-60 repeat protein